MGFSLKDCDIILENIEKLKNLYLKSENYEILYPEQRSSFLIDIAKILEELKSIRPQKLPRTWELILNHWIMGETANKMILTEPRIREEFPSPAKLSGFIEKNICFQLVWGFNSIHVLLSREFEGEQKPLPTVTSFFADFIKYGVYDWRACTLIAYNLEDRILALQIASKFPNELDSPEKITSWLKACSESDLMKSGFNNAEIELIHRIFPNRTLDDSLIFDLKENSPFNAKVNIEKIRIKKPLGFALNQKDRLILQPNKEISEFNYTLYTLNGFKLGSYETKNELLCEYWNTPERLDIYLEDIIAIEDELEITYRFKILTNPNLSF